MTALQIKTGQTDWELGPFPLLTIHLLLQQVTPLTGLGQCQQAFQVPTQSQGTDPVVGDLATDVVGHSFCSIGTQSVDWLVGFLGTLLTALAGGESEGATLTRLKVG